MKVKFTVSQRFEPEWEGNRELPEDERISMTLCPLDLASLVELSDAFRAAGASENNTEVSQTDMMPVLNQFKHVLPQCVTDFKGLSNQDGTAIGVEQIIKYAHFTSLAVEILMKIVEISSPSDSDVKN